ncbi:MAG: 50S ribosomal protein L23 [bacterium]|nr:50S ribosomal protein L23 [bacterium]
MKNNQIIIKPLLTEKATKLASENKYMFFVGLKANKNQIKQAIESAFSVKVKNVNVYKRKGKNVKKGKRQMIKKLSDTKIAYISLKEGKLDIFPKV